MNITDVINHLGIIVDYESDPKTNCGWNGMKFSAKNIETDNLFHEIGHWIASSKERRLLPEFGLGPGPNTTDETYNKIYEDSVKTFGLQSSEDNKLPIKMGEEEEVNACIIEFCLEAMCNSNIDLHQIMIDRNFLQYKSHDWWYSYWEYDDFFVHIKQLKNDKVINKFWVPNCISKIVTSIELEKLNKFRKNLKMVRY